MSQKFHQWTQAALHELQLLDADYLLAENADVLVEALLAKHLPEPVTICWDEAHRSQPQETQQERYDDFTGERYRFSSTRIIVTVPLQGSSSLLTHLASRRYLNGAPGEVTTSGLVLTYEGQPLTAEQVRTGFARDSASLDEMATWANNDLKNQRATLAQRLHQDLERRRARLLQARELDAALDIPVRARALAPSPVPVRRKTVPLQDRRAQAGFAPEPALDDAHYQDILKTVRHWATSLERSPATARKFDEEELRDQLLVTLNAYWEGNAGGELFNGRGKTDLLIRESDRNVFIGECKIWSGAKAAAAAVDQLLGYLVWRDSKAALVMFIRNKNAGQAVESLHRAVREHSRCLLQKPGGDPSSRLDCVLEGDDEGRRIALAVIPVVLGP